MLRTLWQKIKRGAHENVRFLPLVSIIAFIFLVPISLNHHFTPSVAEANWLTDGLVAGLDIILGGLFKVIAWALFKITGMIFVMSGWIFDNSVKYSISGSLYSSFGFINTGWVFIRDLINSLFIFAVLFIGFKHLLSFSSSGTPSGLTTSLKNIVIAALLINFSLFGTKVVIDVSNFMTRAIYYSMESRAVGDLKPSYGPANALTNGLNIQNLLKAESTIDGVEPSELRKGIMYLGGTVIHIMATVMFFAMAFFFLARILVLILLMITSPVYFLSNVFDVGGPIKTYTAKWWPTLRGQAIFPVVFMLIIYIAVSFINSGYMTGASDDSSFASAINGGASGFATIVNFGLVLSLMYFAVKASQEFAGSAGTMGKSLAGKASALGFSTTAWAGRNTLGRAGNKIANSNIARKWASTESRAGNGVSGWMGRKKAGVMRNLGDSVITTGQAMHKTNWDARSNQLLGDTYGVANAKTYQLKTGTPSSKSAATIRERGFGEKTEEGKKKEAAYQQKEVDSFTTVEAKVSYLSSELGDKINNKEYTTVREKLLTEIKTEYKGDTAKQEKLMVNLLGATAYDAPENKKFKNEIVVEKNKKAFKDIAKNHVKASKELEQTKAAVDTYKAANPTATSATSPELATLEAKVTKATEEIEGRAAKAEVLAPDGTVLTPAVEAKKGTNKEYAEISKKVPAASARDLAVADLKYFGKQFSTAQLSAIAGKMTAGEYTTSETEDIQKFIKELRVKQSASPDILMWLKAQAIKDPDLLDLHLEEDIKTVLKDLKASGGAINGDQVAKIKEAAFAMSKKEISSLEIDQLTDLNVRKLFSPKNIYDYAKMIQAEGNQDKIDILEDTADALDIEAASATNPKEIDRLKKLAKAFRGKLK